jgi:hypothetical protein
VIKLQVFLSFLPDSPFVLPMRTHFVYAPAGPNPKGRKLVKIFEEWYGLSHLTRENTRPSILVRKRDPVHIYLPI